MFILGCSAEKKEIYTTDVRSGKIKKSGHDRLLARSAKTGKAISDENYPDLFYCGEVTVSDQACGLYKQPHWRHQAPSNVYHRSPTLRAIRCLRAARKCTNDRTATPRSPS
jgi:hypothetical protein